MENGIILDANEVLQKKNFDLKEKLDERDEVIRNHDTKVKKINLFHKNNLDDAK